MELKAVSEVVIPDLVIGAKAGSTKDDGHLSQLPIQGKGNEFGFEHTENFRCLWDIQGGNIQYVWICGSEAQEEAVRGIRVNEITQGEWAVEQEECPAQNLVESLS